MFELVWDMSSPLNVKNDLEPFPANTGHSPNAVSMLVPRLSKHGAFTQCCFNVGHRLRRWPNIETALVVCPVFAWITYYLHARTILQSLYYKTILQSLQTVTVFSLYTAIYRATMSVKESHDW